jgi:hypothetical protein
MTVDLSTAGSLVSRKSQRIYDGRNWEQCEIGLKDKSNR